MVDWEAEVLNAKAVKNCKELFAKILEQFEVGKLAPAVQNYIKEAVNGKNFKGPLNFKRIEVTCQCIKTYRELFSKGSSQKLFPALLVATEFGGYDFWMLLETGTILCVHHEIYEEIIQYYSELQIEDYDGFVKKLEKNFGLCKMDKLLKLQESLGDYDDLYSIDRILLYSMVSKNLNIPLQKLLKRINDSCFDFLPMNRAILKAMVETETILTDLKANPFGITKLSLSYLETSQLIEIAKTCHNLRELEITHSPSIQWEAAVGQLAKLPELTFLSLEHNALPSIPKGIEKLEHLQYLILSNNNIISFDERIEAMKWLSFLNLKNNPIGHAAQERLAALLPNANVFVKRQQEWKGLERRLGISAGKGIEHYAFVGVELPTDMEDYAHVKSIVIQGYEGVYLGKHIDFIKPLEQLKELQCLYLLEQQYIEIETLVSILQRLEKLECLGIDIFSDAVDELSLLNGLRELSISFAKQSLNNKQIYKTIGKLVNLKKLRIANLQDDGFPNAIRTLRELEELELVLKTECLDWERLFEALGQSKKFHKLTVQFAGDEQLAMEEELKVKLKLKERYPQISLVVERVEEISSNCMPSHRKAQIEGCEFKLGWRNFDEAVQEMLSYENLKSLKLNGSGVGLPSRLHELNSLETLIVNLGDMESSMKSEGYSLAEVQDCLPASLRRLALEKCKGEELEELSSLSSLEELEAVFPERDMGATNAYQLLFNEASKMQRLKALFVRNLGKHTAIPDSFSKLEQLEVVFLQFPSLDTNSVNSDTILTNVSGLTNLQSFILVGGTFACLPAQIGQMKQLKILDLCCKFQNGIEQNLPVIGNMEQLEYLALRMKDLSVSFDSLANLKNIKELVLRGWTDKGMNVNHIIEVCKNFQELYSLSLRNSLLENEEITEAIADLHKLRNLEIVMEGLQRLPDRIRELTELDTLKVSVSKEEINRLKKLLPFCDCTVVK